VVLWEIVTLAKHPYPGLANDQVMAFVVDDERTMDMPIGCPQLFQELIGQCWSYDAHARPTFGSLVERLADFQDDAFRQVDLLDHYSVSGHETRYGICLDFVLLEQSSLFGRRIYGKSCRQCGKIAVDPFHIILSDDRKHLTFLPHISIVVVFIDGRINLPVSYFYRFNRFYRNTYLSIVFPKIRGSGLLFVVTFLAKFRSVEFENCT